jgi:hypothetical protein
MMVKEHVYKSYSHDFMPCDCAGPWSQIGGMRVGEVKCVFLEYNSKAPPDGRGRVWCTCLGCGRSWRESPVPIRDYHGALIRVDATPFAEVAT